MIHQGTGAGTGGNLYRTLPHRYIRILRLRGFGCVNALHGEEVLLGGLEMISLDDVERNHGEYFAISYCWQRHEPIEGLDIKDCYIWCDGHLIILQPNLYSALWHFAMQEDGPRAIWADAICIDQSNLEEKTRQVSMMGDIYRSVGCIVVWWGPEGKKVKELFAALSFYARHGTTSVRSESVTGTPSGGFNSELGVDDGENHTGLAFRIFPWLNWNSPTTRTSFTRPLGRRKVPLKLISDPKPVDVNFDRNEFNHGIDFMRSCGWLGRAWTFQEVCLARHAIVQAGDQKIDWDIIVSGLRQGPNYSISSDSFRKTLQEIHFIELARHDRCDLLFLLRSIWDRDATDKRDKVYAVLGLYRGSLLVEPDYELATRQAMVRVSRATVEETGSLDILHFAGIRNVSKPLWGPMRQTSNRESTNIVLEESDFMGGWHLPSWTPDWGSTGDVISPMTNIGLLKRLEFPKLNRKFRLDVRWNGENIVTAGFALGRIIQFDNPAGLKAKTMIVPFPTCAFNGLTGGKPQWPTSSSLSRTLSSASRLKVPVKTSIAEFANKVKKHDEARCPCSNAVDRPTKSISYNSDHGEYFLLNRSLNFDFAQPLDWVVVLFGARSSTVLRADCRVQPNPWDLRHGPRHPRSYNSPFCCPKQETEDKSQGTFVLADLMDDAGKNWNPQDILNTYREFNQELKHLGCLSCVYGDFEIR